MFRRRDCAALERCADRPVAHRHRRSRPCPTFTRSYCKQPSISASLKPTIALSSRRFSRASDVDGSLQDNPLQAAQHALRQRAVLLVEQQNRPASLATALAEIFRGAAARIAEPGFTSRREHPVEHVQQQIEVVRS